MRIGIDIRHLASANLSGVGYYTLHLIEEMARLAKKDRFILFASGTSETLQNLPEFPQSNVVVSKKIVPNKLLSAGLKIPAGKTLEDIMSERPDVWLFPNVNMIRTRLPYLITAHDLSFDIYPEFFTPKQRLWHAVANVNRLLRDASGILAVSESTKRDVETRYGIPSQRIAVTPLGVRDQFKPKQQPADKNYLRHYDIEPEYFLTLSTLEPRKNITSVIEAYDAWREGIPSDERAPGLVIAGSAGWKTASISQALIRSTHRDAIKLIGYVEDKHKPALYRNARALFFPSFYEGFGLPTLEAMACGTPVVTSFTGSLPEVVGDAAILVDPYNIADLEQAFMHLTDPLLRKTLSQRGVERAAGFTWRQTAELTLEALQKHGKTTHN